MARIKTYSPNFQRVLCRDWINQMVWANSWNRLKSNGASGSTWGRTPSVGRKLTNDTDSPSWQKSWRSRIAAWTSADAWSSPTGDRWLCPTAGLWVTRICPVHRSHRWDNTRATGSHTIYSACRRLHPDADMWYDMYTTGRIHRLQLKGAPSMWYQGRPPYCRFDFASTKCDRRHSARDMSTMNLSTEIGFIFVIVINNRLCFDSTFIEHLLVSGCRVANNEWCCPSSKQICMRWCQNGISMCRYQQCDLNICSSPDASTPFAIIILSINSKTHSTNWRHHLLLS